MHSFTGNTSVQVFTPQWKLPMFLDSFYIVNKTGGTINVNVYKMFGGGIYNIAPLSLALDQGEVYESTRPVVVLATQQIQVHPSGNIDYDFVFSNIIPPV